MQSILCVDASTEPAALQILRVDQKSLELVENHAASLSTLFSNGQAEETQILQEDNSQSEERPQEDVVQSTPYEKPQTDLLGAALQKIETPWTASVLVIPTPEYLSLNIELPFGDPKNLSKILDLEIQDRVPFDISEFLIDHRTLGKSPSGSFDIHVSLIPKSYIARVLKVCRQGGLEPYILTTPASILDALFFIAPDYFRPSCAVFYCAHQAAAVSIRFENQTRIDRIFPKQQLPEGADGSLKALLTDLKLTISAAESRYEKQLERIYVIGDQLSPHELQQLLGRPVEKLNLTELVRNKPPGVTPASIAAVFAQDIAPPSILTNFRTREFTYSLQIRELLRGLRRVLPYVGVVLATLLIFLGGRYALREYQIQSLTSTLRERLLKTVPTATIEDGKEVEWLLNQNFQLQNDLRDLGSPSKYSALDLLAQVTRDFPVVSGVNVREVYIHGSLIEISGTAPDYSAQEKIEKGLKSSKNDWKVNSKDAPGGIGGGSGSRPFKFEIRLLE